MLSTTVCCQYSRRTVELRVVVQQREPTEVALVERERQRPRAALGGVPQQRQLDLPASGIPTYAAATSAVPTYAEAAAGRSAIQSVEVIATVTTVAGTATSPKVSTHTYSRARCPLYGIGSSAASACLPTGEQSVAVYC